MTDETHPAGAGGDCDGVAASSHHPQRWRRWPSGTAAEIVRRTAAGESMLAICRDPQMPGPRIVSSWMAQRPDFRRAIEEARAAALVRGDGVPASPEGPKRWRRWPSAVGHEIVRRTAAGETMLAICRDPQMPGHTIVCRWMAERPIFREAIDKARREAGRSLFDTSTYCRETAEAIFDRLCAGEGMAAICRDPQMPANMTVYRWMAKHEDFRAAVALAREIAAEGFFEKGWELAEGATPETAYLTDVKLKHLRWHAGKLSPGRYGTLKPQDPPAAPADDDDRNNLTVVVKKYGWDGEPVEGPDAREQVLYRMKIPPRTPAQRRAEQAEEAEEERAERAAAEARAAPPEKPWDPEGWT
jgi:hypothetical protein